ELVDEQFAQIIVLVGDAGGLFEPRELPEEAERLDLLRCRRVHVDADVADGVCGQRVVRRRAAPVEGTPGERRAWNQQDDHRGQDPDRESPPAPRRLLSRGWLGPGRWRGRRGRRASLIGPVTVVALLAVLVVRPRRRTRIRHRY